MSSFADAFSAWGRQLSRLVLASDVEVIRVSGWLPTAEADAAFASLHQGIAWRQETIRTGVGPCPLPRLTAWFGDQPYLYSGILNHPLRWTATLAELRRKVEQERGHPFNSCLANLYRDGKDTVGLHADDERSLVPGGEIVSLSLGAPRRFVLRSDLAPKVEMQLEHGDLLVMGTGCQRHWKHAVPRDPTCTAPRISLTFRAMLDR